MIVFDRDTATGGLTAIDTLEDDRENIDGLRGARSVAVSPDNKNVYVASTGDGAVAVFSISQQVKIFKYNSAPSQRSGDISVICNKGSCRICFVRANAGYTNFSLFDAQGRLVRNLVNRHFSASDLMVQANISDCRPGIYFLRVDTKHESWVEKIVIPTDN